MRIVLLAAAIVIIAITYFLTGDGGFRRVITISGIYPILRPGGYDVVCFADADGKEGGLSCLPCDAAKCKK